MKAIRNLFILCLITSFGCNQTTNKDDESKVFLDRNYDHLIDENNIVIGFGSCFDQSKSISIFESIKKSNPDIFVMLGDNVYGDDHSGELDKLESAYQKQKNNFSIIDVQFPIEAIWDDHDYGMNDGGGDFINKENAKKLFLDFWEIPNSDIRNTREGIYFDQIIELKDSKVHLIYLDTRYFRGPLLKTDEFGAKGKERYVPFHNESSTMLGYQQWQWLDKKLSVKSNFKIILSSIQFLAIGHGWESWAMLPIEREKLVNLIDKNNLNNIIFLTGDRHRGGIYKMKTPNENTIFEITSSPINSSTFVGEEMGEHRLGNTYKKTNFGLLNINSTSKKSVMELKDQFGNSVISHNILH